MRPVIISIKTDEHGLPMEYKPYTKAKNELVDELGDFCSYCEKKVNKSSLHIEHIFAKAAADPDGNEKYRHLEYRWDNFLLACSHCNSIKRNKDIALTNPFMPHLNNIVHCIEIIEGGLIKITDNAQDNTLHRTIAFIELVGLDREPSHPDFSEKDDRWLYRYEAHDLAKRQCDKYNARQVDIDTIIELAKSIGFFSVWYYQFLEHTEVLHALIHGIVVNEVRKVPFRGIHKDSFLPPDYTTCQRP